MEYTFTATDFDKEVLASDIPVFVDFFAEWCGPCKMMAPIIEKLAEKYDGRVKVGKCDIDKEEALRMRYKIMSVPTMMIFVNGEIKETFGGVTPQDELERKIDAALA